MWVGICITVDGVPTDHWRLVFFSELKARVTRMARVILSASFVHLW